MNCKKCGAWISIDDYLDYDGLCPYCDEEKESTDKHSNRIPRDSKELRRVEK